MYAAVRAAGAGEPSWLRWREERDHLFATHAQSPVQTAGAGLAWFPYDSAWRLTADFRSEEVGQQWVSEEATFTRLGSLVFGPLALGRYARLAVWWVDGYAGGIFVPFRDATSGVSTYGGGRYLLDSAKGADLGVSGSSVVLDFNFAYQPSCAYDGRWPCPLAPPDNRLDFPVEAGERVAGA